VSVAALLLGGYEDLALTASVSAVSIFVLFVVAIALGKSFGTIGRRGP
jgi:hypothetical protein